MIMDVGTNTPADQRPAPEQAMEAALRAIRLRFIETVLPRLLQFETLKREFTSDPDNIAPLSNIGALAHKIAGVAETLGFGDIGRLSSWIDTEIARGINRGDPPVVVWQTVSTTLEEMLEKMEVLLDATTRDQRTQSADGT